MLPFWLEYWVVAYEHLARSDAVTLLCYEDMCSTPVPALEKLAQLLEIEDPAALVRQALRFKIRPTQSVDIEPGSEALGPVTTRIRPAYFCSITGVRFLSNEDWELPPSKRHRRKGLST